jgi:hypothetical protein
MTFIGMVTWDRERKVEREGVVPPSDWEVQSSIREAPEEKAVWAESGVKQAISSEGIVKFERLNERAIFSLRKWERGWNPVIT